ncbi:hypothetical protein [Chitinophaga sp. YIM B06452]|uniref:hypothetical protein n=1 Tax=Chitinophaga sp. YIM B06452 TaxID=3082158 RepID=UPI0031FECE55
MKGHFITLTMLLFALGTLAGKQFYKKLPILAKYKLSSSPTVCRGPEDLPADCSAVNTGVICELPFGLYFKTYYQNVNCITPYYKIV